MISTAIIALGIVYLSFGAHYLSVHPGEKRFRHNNEYVFMSGMNQAWEHYGNDFGNNRYGHSKAQLELVLKQIHDSGGNSVRIWLHCEGKYTPSFDHHGHVSATDGANSLISDMRNYLRAAKTHEILVFFVLWNGAQPSTAPMAGLITDVPKLRSYVTVLRQMVNQLKDEPALGGWELMNEPEGIVRGLQDNAEPCFSTKKFHGGWAVDSHTNWRPDQVRNKYSMFELQRFFNHQAAAIHEEDPKALVTVGDSSEYFISTTFGRNFFSDECLRKAGGQHAGVLDFYEVHTYANPNHGGKYGPHTPMWNAAYTFGLDKPIVIGEFSSACSQAKGTQHRMQITDMYNHAYYYGYAGAWVWHAIALGECTDTLPDEEQGIRWLKGRNDQQKGGLVKIVI